MGCWEGCRKSEPLRIALVAEGPTDGVVVDCALRAMLNGRSFGLKQIFPEGTAGFGELGTGWVGVYHWCHQSAQRGAGRLAGDELVFLNFDLLILHLDADVAGFHYSGGNASSAATDGGLPCEQPCPPPVGTTDRLRPVLLSWCGEVAPPARVVVCMPSKNTEAWILAALFPQDRAMQQGIEFFRNPEARLAQQPKAKRIAKKKRDYQNRAAELQAAWPQLAAPAASSQARRFQEEMLKAVQDLETGQHEPSRKNHHACSSL